MQIKSAKLLATVADFQKIPSHGLPEIAIAGKSNSGKSSLINTLANRRNLARVGSTPGKTKLVNLFVFNDAFCLVDLPGYGYAAVSKQEQQRWAARVDGYLSGSQALRHMLLLMDIRRDPSPDDIQLCQFMLYQQLPYTLIATKADKVSKSQRKVRTDAIQRALHLPGESVIIPFSAQDRTGLDALLARLDDVLATVTAQQ
ncbi:MAG: ribosome biogenesis GTP-binding protein YihA/YsxC [Christensenellales bacterium]|jgi:GTP-binding protein